MVDDTFEQIRSIVADYYEIDRSKVTLVTSFFYDLEADSIDTIELVMALEEAFDVVIPDDAAETIVTMQDAVYYIKQQQRNPRRPDIPDSESAPL
jgi:acyl carrier protein